MCVKIYSSSEKSQFFQTATGPVQPATVQHGEDFAEDLPGAGAADREDEGGGAGDEEPAERAGVLRDQVSGPREDAEWVGLILMRKILVGKY